MVELPAAGRNRAGAPAPAAVRDPGSLGALGVTAAPGCRAGAPGAGARDYRGVSRKRSSSLSVPRIKNVPGSIVRS